MTEALERKWRPEHKDEEAGKSQGQGDVFPSRMLRSRYLQVKHRISDERDDMAKADPDKFKSILEEIDDLHQLVKKPREQVADAEALSEVTSVLLTSIRAHCNGGLTPADFISCLLKNFGPQGGSSGSSAVGDCSSSAIQWKDIGLVFSHVFSITPGCSTMVGPMNIEIKPRKIRVYKKRTKRTEKATPDELEGPVSQEKTDTDENMATMFDILKKNKTAKLENIILNRNSFAQTIENLFALSFLVKDGRAELTVDEQGCHLVSPRNAPASIDVISKHVSYGQFVFRLDYRDWELMRTYVAEGDELMPHRADMASPETQTMLSTTPTMKFSKNQAVLQSSKSIV